MTPETALELSKIKNIVGIKEASGKMDHVDVLKTQVSKPFLLSSGDDATTIDFILRGGHGVISVLSHVIPKEFRRLCDFARAGDAEASEAYKRYNRLNQLLGIEANPIPVKMMLYQMGIIASPEMRLPLVALSKENTELVKAELKSLELI
jgi:4-hydroxy-tetrahydrodipicolinate synthase